MQIQNVTAGYGDKKVVKQVSLSFEEGKITALVGPNGSGKSTLLRVAARLLEPEQGRVLLKGRDAGQLTAKEYARQVALLPQSRGVPEITVGALVLHGRFPYLGYPRRYSRKDREIAGAAMELTGVAHLEQEYVSKLSGGQRQKVYLAMAVAQDTPILLLDEPTTFLDIGCQLDMMALSRRLAEQGRAVVMVLHDLNLAMTCADRLAVMENGRVLGTGSPEEIWESDLLKQVFGVEAHCIPMEQGGRQYLFTK